MDAVAENWLFKLADRAESLFRKYWPMALRRFGDRYSEKEFRRLIDEALRFSKKYSQWYVYQFLHDANGFADLHNSWREVSDWIKKGNGIIPDLKTPIPDILEKTEEWHRLTSQEAAEYQTHDVIAKLSDGFELVKLAPEDLKAEGYYMGHCVKDYETEVKSGYLEVVSLRDSKNEPHATIGIFPEKTDTGVPYYSINQMKGKENKPQPKYGDLIDEAIKLLLEKYRITFDDVGWVDYTGFQEDEDRQRQLVRQIVDHYPELEHSNGIFEVYRYTKRLPDKNELIRYLEEANQDNQEYSYDEFGEWLLELDPDMFIEVINEFVADGYIDDEDAEEYITDLKDGNFPYIDDSNLSEMVAQQFNSMISIAHEDRDNEIAYLVDRQTEQVVHGYLNWMYASDYPGSEFGDEPSEDYERWMNILAKEKRDAAEKAWQDRFNRILQKYNIVIPPDAFDDVIRRARFFKPNLNDEEFAKQLEAEITRWSEEDKRLELSRQRFDQKVDRWTQEISQVIPQYAQVPDYDKRHITNHFNVEHPTPEVLNYTRLYLQNKLGIPVTANSWRHKYAAKPMALPAYPSRAPNPKIEKGHYRIDDAMTEQTADEERKRNPDIEYVGAGDQGTAFEISPGIMVKYTLSMFEAEVAYRAYKNKYPFIAAILEAPRQIQEGDHPIWAITMEKVAPLPHYESIIIGIIRTMMFRDGLYPSLVYLANNLEYYKIDPKLLKKIYEEYTRLVKGLWNAGLKVKDAHPRNLGRTKDGRLVLFDLGLTHPLDRREDSQESSYADTTSDSSSWTT